MVKICSMIVLVFIICNMPRLVLGLFEVTRFDTNNKIISFTNYPYYRIPDIIKCFHMKIFYFAPLEQWLCDFVARYLVILNSSINFIIYCLVGSEFRKAFGQVFWSYSYHPPDQDLVLVG